MKKHFSLLLPLLAITFLWQGCHTIDDNRIPNMPVNINLSNPGVWNVFGVSGFGSYQNFILTNGGVHIPASFQYSSQSATGFGGVLLIEGLDPYTAVSGVPLAYDLSCPVERQPDIRVIILEDSYNAHCPVCGSTYDVTVAAGAPLSGPAAEGKHKYGLKPYRCVASGNGGYYITN